MKNKMRTAPNASQLKKNRTRPITVADILASKWTLPIVRVLQQDTLRYNSIEKVLPEVTQKVLVETLRKLERNGIVHRSVYATVPPQVEYKLSPLGLDLLHLSNTLTEWVDMHEEEIKRAQKAYDRRNKS